MNDLKNKFIEFTLDHEILRFGNFTLNSGRKSPYFFNTGLCNDGSKLTTLSKFYCELIIQENLDFDFVYGPAYKGIPLATSISMSLHTSYNVIKPYCFNRKEPKTHGDMGLFVGHKPTGNALIIDDVVSSGKSIIDSIELLSADGSTPKIAIVAFDRMEKGIDDRASKEIKEKFNVDVYSIITLDDIVNYMSNDKTLFSYLKLMKEYISEYKR